MSRKRPVWMRSVSPEAALRTGAHGEEITLLPGRIVAVLPETALSDQSGEDDSEFMAIATPEDGYKEVARETAMAWDPATRSDNQTDWDAVINLLRSDEPDTELIFG